MFCGCSLCEADEPFDPTVVGTPGELGYGEFLYRCLSPSDPVCDGGETYVLFPGCVALGATFEEAADAYDSAVALLPAIEQQHWVLLYQRGIALERSDQWEKAEADFRQALELEPDQPDVLKAYATGHGANPDRWLFLTGPESAVARLVRDGFRAPMSRSGSDHTIVHSERFAVVDRRGRIRAYLEGARDDLPVQVRQVVRRLLAET